MILQLHTCRYWFSLISVFNQIRSKIERASTWGPRRSRSLARKIQRNRRSQRHLFADLQIASTRISISKEIEFDDQFHDRFLSPPYFKPRVTTVVFFFCASYIFLIFFIFFMLFVDFAHFYGNLDSFSVLEYRLIDPLLFHEIENKISQFFRIILNWSRFPVFKKIILGNISVSSITFLPKGHCQSIF